MVSGDAAIVERMFELWDEERFDEVWECLDDDLVMLPATGEGRVYRGEEGFRTFVAEAQAAGRHLLVTTSEIREHGGKVVVLGRIQTREPGRIVDIPAGWVAEVREDRVHRIAGFTDHDEALAAAGLGPRRR